MANIGKNVIENLTTAMYENSFIIYREYIQNAADSIDKAVSQGVIDKKDAIIDILIEQGKRCITIHDNAMGISKDNFYRTLSNIADSEKDRDVDKGFRGIGRLGGLAYCDKLIFSSSLLGENIKSVMVWDGRLLRKILADTTQHLSASELVDRLISCRQEKCESNEHFFEVALEGVIPESDDLLDVSKVCEYLQEVAPIPYANTFIFRSKIYEFVSHSGLQLDEYCILVNGNQLFKPYKSQLYMVIKGKEKPYDQIYDLEFRKFEDKNGNLLGWLWIAVTGYEKQIPIINKMRGIRIRKGNIQIGNEETLFKFYKEPRGNLYFIGELFAVAKDLIPNARRDYFNINSTLKEFEAKIKPVLFMEFYSLYHYANNVKKACEKVVEYEKQTQEYKEKTNRAKFINNDEKDAAKKILEEKKAELKKINRQLELRKEDSKKNNMLSRVYNALEKKYRTSNIQDLEPPEINENEEHKKKNKFLSQSLTKYNKKEQKLVSRIYVIIKAILPKDMAEMVVEKIQEELSK